MSRLCINDTSVDNEQLCCTLLSMSDIDVANYCTNNIYAKQLYTNDKFWFDKLNLAFGHVTPDGNALIPSEYVTKYIGEREPAIESYKRWILFKFIDFKTEPLNDELIAQYMDVLIYELAQHRIAYSMTRIKLMNYAIKNNRLDIIMECDGR
jgi:hypothetical protein